MYHPLYHPVDLIQHKVWSGGSSFSTRFYIEASDGPRNIGLVYSSWTYIGSAQGKSYSHTIFQMWNHTK